MCWEMPNIIFFFLYVANWQSMANGRENMEVKREQTGEEHLIRRRPKGKGGVRANCLHCLLVSGCLPAPHPDSDNQLT